VELAIASRRPDQWSEYKEVLSAEARSLFAGERVAKLVQKYEPTIVPGLFQTEDYARALLTELGTDPAKIDRRVEARLRRQELFEEASQPDLDFIIGEASVSRPIGGKGVMLDQIEHLKKVSTRANVTLRFIPFAVGAHPGMGSAFTILQFSDPDLPDLVYLESVDKESIIREDQDEVRRYGERFIKLTEIASSAEEVPSILDRLADRMRRGSY